MNIQNSFALLERFGILPKQFIYITGILALVYAFPPALLPVYLVLAVYAFRGPRQAIEALSISLLLVFLNPGLFSLSGNILLLRWLVFLAAIVRVFLTFVERELSVPGPVFASLFFLVIIGGLSVVSSYQPMISVLKLLQFIIGIITILYAFQFTAEEKEYWTRWFTSFFIVVLILSFPLYFMAAGYHRVSSSFQGLLNQPQAWGVFLAPVTAWFIARFLSGEDRAPYIIPGIIAGSFFIFASDARVALAAMVLGFVFAFIVKVIRGDRFLPFQSSRFGASIYPLTVIIIVLFGFMNFNEIKESYQDFIHKGKEFTTIGEGYHQTRGMLIERSLENFRDHPVTGIGFGIGSDIHRFEAKRTESLGLVIGASTEKGFIGSAILEEIGIFGTFIFLIFLCSLILYVYKHGTYSQAVLMFSAFSVNIAEMVLFSFGGLGLYIWLLIGYAIMPSNETQK